MKATILYYSRKGKTAYYAREIAMYLWSKGCDVSLASISDYKRENIEQSDVLILGCWTCGLFIVNQHPHKKWVSTVSEFSDILPDKMLLFTTYKFRTGTLFRKMRRAMGIKWKADIPELKSKTGFLTDNDKSILNELIDLNFNYEKRKEIDQQFRGSDSRQPKCCHSREKGTYATTGCMVP